MGTEIANPVGFSPRPGITITQLCYRDVLQAKGRVGHVDVLTEHAKILGYEYILWNDRVYFLTGESRKDTGLTVADIN
jgi:hypothetical protein